MMKPPWRREPRPMTCHEVAGILQAFLDDETDQVAARRVAHHLHDCVRCGLEAATYERIKRSVALGRPALDPPAVARLRRFGEQLATPRPDGPEAQSPSQ